MTAHPWLAVPIWVAFYVPSFMAVNMIFGLEGSFGEQLFYAIVISIGQAVGEQSRRPPREPLDNETRPISVGGLQAVLAGGFVALTVLLGLLIRIAR